ncbi:IS3 family transposase [Oceanidesulfovibrio marinus]|uniref:IS3 family transposase n=1 Tax=Oceanidesulfovibrio marinus TaxID=370038 RepID=A0ABX6NJ25_9BACT|nr:IS3 family transposase [Oceanidesulfovibrio marinus]QJT10668.1 IS3 family transposase [Oceanidesulfovibrio marinus]
MKRGPYPKVASRNTLLLQRIRAIKADHPYWGYRRIWAHLRFVDTMSIGKHRVYRLMRDHGLCVKRGAVPATNRKPSRPKPRPTRPNEWWGTDMTKVMIDGFGWMYVVIVLDWRTKKVVGHYAGAQARTEHWLAALDQAVNRQFPEGVRGGGLHLMSDNGSQPTSLSFMKTCHCLGITQAFTAYNNPKGNADTERFMRTLKEELVWVNEWRSPTAFCEALSRWIDDYNAHYLHSTLGYRTPLAVEQELLNPNLPLQEAC